MIENSSDKRHERSYLLLFFFTLFLFISFLSPFWAPLILAAIFAFGLIPYIDRWFERGHSGSIKNRWIALTLSLLTLLMLIPLGLLIFSVTERVLELSDLDQSTLVAKGKGLKDFIVAKIHTLGEFTGINVSNYVNKTLDSALNAAKGLALGTAGFLVKAIPDILMNFFIFLLALYVFIRYSDATKKLLLSLDLFKERHLNQFIDVLQKSSTNTLFSLFILGSAQAFIVTLAAMFLGFSDYLGIFAITFLCSFIPVIGAGPVAVVLAIVQFSQGEVGYGVGLLIVAGVAGSIDNILKPFMLSNEDELPGVPNLIVLIGAILVFGFTGLFLGPVIGSLLSHLIKHYQTRNKPLIVQAKEKTQ